MPFPGSGRCSTAFVRRSGFLSFVLLAPAAALPVRRLGPLGLALAALVPAGLSAQAPDRSAELFGRFAGRVVKIEVVETGSGAKASLGTGFFVTGEGHLVTNYHVVAEVAHEPARYRAQWVDQGGTTRAAFVIAIDVVADLAVLSTGVPADGFFTLDPPSIPRGMRLYSLGHPQDLGLSIVEGTYNGLLAHALYPKIHFTGPLNPGMSGGPALTGEGRVVGVNVSTGGNSISFLVPVERARALLGRALSTPEPAEAGLLKRAGAQVLEHQDRYLAALFQDGRPPVRLGPFELPSQPADYFRCWGDADRDPDALYERVVHRCSTDDYVFLTAGQSSGVITLQHQLLTSRGLNPARFYALYSAGFAGPAFDPFQFELEPSDDLTDPRCRTGNVRRQDILLRTVLCVRGYHDFPGLYDATLRAAVLGARDVGLITTLTLSGVSFANAERLAREYLAGIRWAAP